MQKAKSRGRARAPLSRAQIAEAGFRLLNRDGPDGLSMRKLAEELGVEAMSLYNHVRDKDELLQEIANLAVAMVRLPNPARPWRARLEALAISLYEALAHHPHALILLARDEVQLSSPKALAVLEAGAAALAESGLPPARRVSAFRGLISLCFGFALTHTRGAASTRAEAQAVWSQWDQTQWDGRGLPHLATLAPQFLKTKAGDDLAFTLKVYLDALVREAT